MNVEDNLANHDEVDETDCDLVTSPGILFTDDIAEEINDSAPGARRSRKSPNRYGQWVTK